MNVEETVKTDEITVKLNGNLPNEVKDFFIRYRKDRKKRFSSVSDLLEFHLKKYLENPNRFKYDPVKIESYRKKLEAADYRNNLNIYISEEYKNRLEELAFSNYRTVTAQFNLFLLALYSKLDK